MLIFILRQVLIKKLVVYIKIRSWQYLEQRLPIEINLIEIRVFLIVNVRVSESK